MEYRKSEVLSWKAGRVSKKIRSFMSEDAWKHLYRASLHNSPERADRILRFIALGLKYGRQTVKMLQAPEVYEIFQMDRYVGNEAHLIVEFLRFDKLSNGVFYGKIGPENRILELAAEHFADRFPDMNWVIYDETHEAAALHSEKGIWVLKEPVTSEEMEQWKGDSPEDQYSGMWKICFDTIAIEERKNPRCQRNMMPLRYRKYMTEWR